MKASLNEITNSLKKITATQTQLLRQQKAHDESIKDIQDPLRHGSSTTFQRETALVVNGRIFVFGGQYFNEEIGKSFEVYNLSTKTWTLIKKSLFFRRHYSFSFVYEKKIMICGGSSTGRIEYLNPSESGYNSTTSMVSLPHDSKYNGVLYKNRILSFYKGVIETSVESSEESRTLSEEKKSRNCPAGVHCFGNNVYIVGGQPGSMEKYDVVKNEMKTLPSLPCSVSCMATVTYKDNIIIIGGEEGASSSWKPLNDVMMYNIHSHECKRLPSMLEKRSACSAVVMGDVIVAMGGQTKDAGGKTVNRRTVKYHVIGEDTWKELPPMNLARYGATACVYDWT